MEGQTSIGDMIRFSWTKSLGILFPFNFKRWLSVLIIVWLAGAGVQGASLNFRTPGKSAKTQPAAGKTAAVSPSAVTSTQAQGSSVVTVASPETPASNNRALPRGSRAVKNPAWSIWLVAGAVCLVLGFMFFSTWLSSRFSFILLDTVTKRNASIREPFREHRELGNSYFKWSLAFLGILVGTLLVLGLVSFMLFGIAKGHTAMIILLGILMGLLVIAFILGMSVTGTAMRDLVLPIMYREKIPAMVALNRFLDANTFAFGKVFQYVLVIFGLGIVASIAQGIVSVVVALCGLIAGGIVVVPGFFLLKALPLLKLPLIILGVLVVIAVILAVIIAIGMVMLPVAIFFRIFALSYLTRLYPDCDLLGLTGDKP